jgi:lipopolysaccharide transport system permease protein
LSNADMIFLTGPYLSLYRYRDVLLRTLRSEFRLKYAGSALGAAWYVLAPLMLMGLYAVVYLAIFKVRPASMTGTDYVLYVFSGLIPFLGFSDSLASGSASLARNKAVLLSTVFPAELAPLRAVCVSQGAAAVGLALTVTLALGLGKLSPALMLLPLVWLALALFVSGIVWVLALASLVIRDIQPALAIASLALLIASPIGYTPDMVPRALAPLLYLNPLSSYVISFQDIIVFGRAPDPVVLAMAVALGILSFSFGYWVFQKAKRVFFDYA